MAGGSGKRFWPESRSKKPKQLLNIVGRSSLIDQTFQRAKKLCPPERILVVTNESQKKDIFRELKGIPKKNIISEPEVRDTAACIGLAAVIISAKDENACMIVLPADHIIKNTISFKKVMLSACKAAEDGFLVTCGIKPAFASTAYGYIEKEKERYKYKNTFFYRVKKFHEKPDIRKAARFARSGSFFWNSGIFVWKADVFLEYLKKYLKKTYNGLLSVKKSIGSEKKFKIALKKVYKHFSKISVDYAVMEKADKVVIAVCDDFVWDDIGSWSSLERHYVRDKKRNVVIGDVLTADTTDCVIVNRGSNGQRLTAAVGVKGLIIIQKDDVVLVCDKAKDQDVKKILSAIEINKKYKRLFT